MSKTRRTRQARRHLLKSLVAGGGVMATGKLLPDHWTRPVVESVVLPAHGQTTDEGVSFDGVFLFEGGVVRMQPSTEPEGILDMFASPAYAQVACNTLSTIQFSVSGGAAMVCVSQDDGNAAEDTTTVDVSTRSLADVKVGAFGFVLSSMQFDPDGNRIIGNSDCGPFAAARTQLPFNCTNTLAKTHLSSPYAGLA